MRNEKKSAKGFSGPYHDASVIVNKMLKKCSNTKKGNGSTYAAAIGGLKSYVFKTNDTTNQSEMTCSRATYATICQTLQSKPLIDKILDHRGGKWRNHVMKKCKNVGLLYIMLHELLFSKFQSIRGGGGLKREVLKIEGDLRELKDELNLRSSQDTAHIGMKIPRFPRYARLNTIKSSTRQVVSILSDLRRKHPKIDEMTFKVFKDRHVPDLLVLHPKIMDSGISFHSHPFVQKGNIILQDKASCFPALAVYSTTSSPSSVTSTCNPSSAHPVSGDILDACAAPGNKTSHLVSLQHQRVNAYNAVNPKDNMSSKIFALDRDEARYAILKNRMNLSLESDTVFVHHHHSSSLGTLNKSRKEKVEVHTQQADFLETSPDDPAFKDLRAILLDPSCSGSGIMNSLERSNENHDTEEYHRRIESLAKFQLLCLQHAMSFPQVVRIVYSTCSIHEEENEMVVVAALGLQETEAWELVEPFNLSSWSRRGKIVEGLNAEQARCLLRCDANDGDETNGFFVSCFQRVSEGNELFKKAENINETVSGKAVKDGDIDLPFYNGEFKQCDDTPNEEEKPLNKDSTNTTGKKEKKMAAKDNVINLRDDGNVLSSEDVATKKKKVLLWKKRQREGKKERLRKKKKKANDV